MPAVPGVAIYCAPMSDYPESIEVAHGVFLPFPVEFADHPMAEALIAMYCESAAEFLEEVEEELTTDSLIRATKRIYQYFDELMDEAPTTVFFADTGKQELACTRGCYHCCRFRVTCTAPAILTMAKELKKELTPLQLEALMHRIERHEKQTAEMAPGLQAIRPRLCPLNVDGDCIAYEARPISCRAYHSFNVEKCIESASEDKSPEVPIDSARKLLEIVVTMAFDACLEHLKLDGLELEFIPALNIALQPTFDPGQANLASAHRPDVILAAEAASAIHLRVVE